MAETQEIVFKSVQELAHNNQLPENYIHAQGSINTSSPLLDVPQVDFSLLTSPARQQELNKLQSGLKSCGCIQTLISATTPSPSRGWTFLGYATSQALQKQPEVQVAKICFLQKTMAETQEIVFKSVQELAHNNQLPENYIHAQGSINTSSPLLDVPQVDFSLLTSPARQQELNKLQSGLKSCGCIQTLISATTPSPSRGWTFLGYATSQALQKQPEVQVAKICFLQKTMAETQEIVFKSIQELAHNNQLPENYIHAQGSINTSSPLLDVPQVDFSLLTSPARQQELNKLQSGLKSCGCIQTLISATTPSPSRGWTFLGYATSQALQKQPEVQVAKICFLQKTMAETQEIVFKSVQELAHNNQLPENYIHAQGSINTSSPLLDVPQVDFSLLTSPARQQELNKLQSGLKSCGCIQVINHGMTDAFLDKVHEISKQFFALPAEEKLKYARTVDDIEGYGNDKVLTDKQRLDWSDRLYLNVLPEDIRKLQFWPQKPECFRDIFEEYIKNMKSLSESLLKAMAASLNVEENCFLDQCGERGTMIARFNFYPPCPRPDVVLGVKPHADASAITILLQDKEVEGLQVLKDDQWFRVPVVPYGLLINVGDQVEIMSNGIFKSPVHRVVTNAERERNTLAVFIMPDVDVGIGPVEKLINEETPRAYKDVKNYVALFFQSYQQGKRPIEAAKICQELQ